MKAWRKGWVYKGGNTARRTMGNNTEESFTAQTSCSLGGPSGPLGGAAAPVVPKQFRD